MLLKILIGIAVIIVAFVVVVAMQPSDFRIARATTTAVPAEAVFAQVSDFRKWAAWSPYEKIDPALKRSDSGATSGIGSVYEWAGDKNVGEGRATITESQPDERVRIQPEFLKPFGAANIVELDLTPANGQTTITWAMAGHNNFMFKAVGLFMNRDKMAGGQFEQGLANLQSLLETTPAS